MNRNRIRISKPIQALFVSLAGLLFFACDDVNTIQGFIPEVWIR